MMRYKDRTKRLEVPYQRSAHHLKPTKAQLDYIASLHARVGGKITEPANRVEASDLIALLERRIPRAPSSAEASPTAKQLTLIDRLAKIRGVRPPRLRTRREASRLIDEWKATTTGT